MSRRANVNRHGANHGRGGSDEIPAGIDSSENAGENWGVHSVEPTGDFEAEAYVLEADGAGGSRWSPNIAANAGSLPAAILAASPDAFWKLSETSGLVAADSSGNGYDLTSSGAVAPSWGQAAGPPGEVTAGFGTASNQGLARTGAGYPTLSSGDFTAVGWVYYTDDDTADVYALIGQGTSSPEGSGGQGWMLAIGGSSTGYNKKLAIFVNNGSVSPGVALSDSQLTVGTWYMVAVVKLSGVYYLYVNGAVQAATTNHAITNQNGIYLANTTGANTTYHLDGRLSYWATFGRALSAGELASFYNLGIVGGTAPAGYVLHAIGSGGAYWAPVSESDFGFIDTTTADASATKHGLLKKLSNVATQFLDGTGVWRNLVESDLALTDNTTNDASSSKHGFLKKLSNVATQFLDGTGVWRALVESDLSTSDNTTLDVSTSKHGFAPKAPNDTAKFLRGDGTWASARGGGGGSSAVSTDVIWDAKGDVAAGTGADAASKLSVGANGKVLVADSAQTTGLVWDYRGLLAAAYYNPSSGVVTKTATTGVVALDTTNLRATFVAPASGNVVVKCGGGRMLPNNSNPFVCVLDGSTTKDAAIQSAANATFFRPEATFRITGLTPGTSYSYDLAFRATNLTTAATWLYGYTTDVFNSGTGTVFIEVWAAP